MQPPQIVNRTVTYIVKHSTANVGNPAYPGIGISKILRSGRMGTEYTHFAPAQ